MNISDGILGRRLQGADAIASSTPYVGNTASAAYEIHKQVGGDIFEIVTVNTYPVDHKASSEIVERELKANARPALSTHVKDMASYDVIFLGYPIWWYTEPMAIRTFLEEYDFSGKTIVPFCTTLGAGIAESVQDIKSICPNSTVLEGVTLRTAHLPVKVKLFDSDNDYCGDIVPPLAYKKEEVQYGYKNGDLAFWTAGNDFVIFIDDEERSANTGNLVIIGKVTSGLEKIRTLGKSIDVTIALAE